MLLCHWRMPGDVQPHHTLPFSHQHHQMPHVLVASLSDVLVSRDMDILTHLIALCTMISIDEPLNGPSVPRWVSQHTKPMSNLVPLDDPQYDDTKHATIFVAIAAYRDPECRNTVLQIFEHAAYPDRLRVGIFTQNEINTDEDCADFRDVLNCDAAHSEQYEHLYVHDDDDPIEVGVKLNLTEDQMKKVKRGVKQNTWSQEYKGTPHVLCGRLHQVKTQRVDWRDGLGPTYGRYRAELFYDDEEYYLQMDSHTAFRLRLYLKK